jgi:hypothetical protein
MPSEAGGAWQVLKEHGKSLVAVLKAWDAEDVSGVCGKADFRRAAQALGALGLSARIPTDVELDAMFDHITHGKSETMDFAELLKRPLEPATFDEIEDDPFDPDDCFEGFGEGCMACGKPAEPGKKLLGCQRCKSRVKYCSRACQLAGWRLGHKESCGKRRLPTPSKVAHGNPAAVLPMLSEFHACHGGLAYAIVSRLAQLALDEHSERHLRAMIDWPGGVDAIVKSMKCYAGHRELILPGYMLICALCSTAREGAAAVVQADGLEPLVDLLKVSVDEPHLLTEGLRAMKQMAATGATGKQMLVDQQGVFGIVWAMREHQEDVPLLLEAVGALSNIAYRGGIDIRKYVIYNSGVEGVCTVMRKHVDATNKNEALAEAGVTALRMMVAGDDSGIICGTAADVAHAMTTAMTKYLGIEAVVDAMMYHLGNETIQENGAAVIANVASIDLGAKRQHEVQHGSKLADTQATRNLIDALIPIAKAIRRFPSLGSPRHALHVITANLGSPKEALEAGCERDWLPLALQFEKDQEEKL